MNWRDGAIIIAMISALLMFLLARNAQPADSCREPVTSSAHGGKLCDTSTP